MSCQLAYTDSAHIDTIYNYEQQLREVTMTDCNAYEEVNIQRLKIHAANSTLFVKISFSINGENRHDLPLLNVNFCELFALKFEQYLYININLAIPGIYIRINTD